MANETLRVIVTDDDFMIANLHTKFVKSQPGYQVVGTANNFEQTLQLIKETRPDLLVLDVYLPDHSGIDLLRTIRAQNIPCDVILITAAKELDIVEEGFRLGIFDYLIKPFDLEHLKKSLVKYAQFKSRLQATVNLNQELVDDLKKLRSMSPISKELQSGIDVRTLELIKQCLIGSKKAQGAEDIAKLAGVSRSTARTYLAHLVEEGFAEEQLRYGTVGRPQRVYQITSKEIV